METFWWIVAIISVWGMSFILGCAFNVSGQISRKEEADEREIKLNKEAERIPDICFFIGTCSVTARDKCPKICPKYRDFIAEANWKCTYDE